MLATAGVSSIPGSTVYWQWSPQLQGCPLYGGLQYCTTGLLHMITTPVRWVVLVHHALALRLHVLASLGMYTLMGILCQSDHTPHAICVRLYTYLYRIWMVECTIPVLYSK